ncbi:MAG: transposase [Beduini sp.]|uniref:helix-turn-helix domain-containing protein n=2 Tax=Beduini sp. TaxID=1922300 RepID=UPI0011C9413E
MYSISNKNKLLTHQERLIIETGIRNGSSKKAIADTLGKEKSTIGKEIKLHRINSYKCKLPLECSNYAKCKHGRFCSTSCPDYIPFSCSRRDRSPGACNGCSKFSSCRFDKFFYKPDLTHKEYCSSLINTRIGINVTVNEIKQLGSILLPLLKQGQSIYQILASHPELSYSEKTLYTYIEDGVFKNVGIDISVFDLRRKVSRKIPKKKAITYKKREDRRFLKGRLYSDYKALMLEHPDFNVVQMDTVYNDVSNGPFIQTFKFIKYGFMFAILHDKKDAQNMLEGVNLLESIITPELFNTKVQVLLTDRGSEFTAADAMEIREDNARRTSVYYCDPLQSCQKGSLENNHIGLCYICPSGTNLHKLGLLDQEDLNTVISHINSSPKEKLNGKSPIEYLEFLNPVLMKKFYDFGMTKIDKDKVTLKPYLLLK